MDVLLAREHRSHGGGPTLTIPNRTRAMQTLDHLSLLSSTATCSVGVLTCSVGVARKTRVGGCLPRVGDAAFAGRTLDERGYSVSLAPGMRPVPRKNQTFVTFRSPLIPATCRAGQIFARAQRL